MSEQQPVPRPGRLRIFLGYAAGVGKTYQMLDEAQEAARQGVDVVIGYFEPHDRKDTIAKTEGLEAIPPKMVEHRGSRFREMDLDAILARRPALCCVDEFAHTNVPGSRHMKRWEDVALLREQGIDVLTTMNVQHLESLNDQIFQFTGVRVRETVPDWVVNQADEVEMVDVTPRALLNRLERGVIYGPEKAQTALNNFFKESSLVALREFALRQIAHELDCRQRGEDGCIEPPASAVRSPERILVYVTPSPSTAMLIRRGKRVADFLQGSCLAAAVLPGKANNSVAGNAIERHLHFARNLHIETKVLRGDDVAETLVDFARGSRVTQLYMTREESPRWRWPMPTDLVGEVVRRARDMQVTVISSNRFAS